MAISRMQQPRQMYGLGSFVKKAFRGVKKIAKSPMGKMAIMAGLGSIPFGAAGSKASLFSRLGGALSGGAGLGINGGRNMLNIAGPKTGFLNSAGGFLKSMIPGTAGFSGKNLFMGLGATAVASPYLQKAFAKPEEIVEEVDEDYIPPYMAYQMSRNRDPYMNFLPNEARAQSGYFTQNVANGGRIGYAGGTIVEDEEDINLNRPFNMGNMMSRTGYANGEMVETSMTEEVRLPDEAEQMLQVEYQKYVEGGGQLPYPEFKKLVLQQMQQERSTPDETMVAETETVEAAPTAMMAGGGLTSVPGYGTPAGTNKFGYPSGGVRMGAEEGGLMNLGGMEKDYRAEGGFVPIGAKEKADDVPARLSVNEFVFTADAVRNAGGGDIDKGAEVMENMMNHLENGGQVSEESQGGEGAQAMYDQQQMLQSRMG
jgi:hypothetical protein